jgi:hypothetical protein
MRDHINLERPKHSLDKLVVVDEVPIWLEAESDSSGEAAGRSFTESSGWSSVSGTSEGTGESYRTSAGLPPEQTGAGVSSGISSAEGVSGGYAETVSSSTFKSSTRGRSQTLKPVREVMPTAVHSLEEEVHRLVKVLRGLPDRVAMARPAGRTAVRVRTPDVSQPIVWPELTATFLGTISDASPYVVSVKDAEAEMSTRRKKLFGPSEPIDTDGEFWHESVPPKRRVE